MFVLAFAAVAVAIMLEGGFTLFNKQGFIWVGLRQMRDGLVYCQFIFVFISYAIIRLGLIQL